MKGTWGPLAKRPSAPAIATAAWANGSYIPFGGPAWNTYDRTGQFGAFRNIGELDIYSGDFNTVCGNTQNTAGGWAGNFFCTTSYAAHLYNQSYRRGWAGAGELSDTVVASAEEFYES